MLPSKYGNNEMSNSLNSAYLEVLCTGWCMALALFSPEGKFWLWS
jgi:hypothetical protein